jgi:hypothetical protein
VEQLACIKDFFLPNKQMMTRFSSIAPRGKVDVEKEEIGSSPTSSTATSTTTAITTDASNNTPGNTDNRGNKQHDTDEWEKDDGDIDIGFNDDLLDFNIDLSFERERSLAIRAWYLVMGAVATLDFIAAMLSEDFFISQNSDSSISSSLSPFSSSPAWRMPTKVVMDIKERFFHVEPHVHYDDDEEEVFTDDLAEWWLITPLTPFVQWLKKHSANLGLLFSLLWFVDSFVVAYTSRIRATLRIDQKRLLVRTVEVEKDEGEDESSNKASSNSSYMVHWFKTPMAVYFQSILVQLLLLPVGFYVYTYSALKLHRLQHVEGQEIRIVHTRQHHQNESRFLHIVNNQHRNEFAVDTFTMNTNLSLIIAIVHHIIMELSTRVKLRFATQSVVRARMAAKKLAWKAIRDPRAFARKLKTALYCFRWIKYLAPLIGTFNKFLGNAEDLVKLYKQKRRARHAHQLRARLRYEMSSDQRREHAVMLIQKQYRTHLARQYTRALQLLQGNKERFAVLRLQRQFKSSLQRARARLARKRADLLNLQKRATELQKKAKVMDADERLQMYHIQNELEKKTKEMLNEKLLMRPNTSFAIAWKAIFVVTVVFEILTKVMAPLIKDQNVDGFLQQHLVPIPVSLLPQCLPPEEPGAHWPKVLRPLSKVLYLRRALPLFLGGTRAPIPRPLPWYCENLYYAFFQTLAIIFLELLIHRFLTIVGIIGYLDVFITFFTGQFDQTTGRLVPKPFFQRWIVPGMVLQLLVNPQMGTTSKWVWQAWVGVFHLGPVRCLRWTIALLFPLLMSTKRWIKRSWHKLVVDQNQKIKYSLYTNALEQRVCTAFRVSIPPDATRRMSTKCIEFRGSTIFR